MIKLKMIGQSPLNSQVAFDFRRHLLKRIRTVHILWPFIRPLCHQYVMIIIRKGLRGLRHQLINRIRKNPNIPPGILSNASEKFFIQIFVLRERERERGNEKQ
jgi:hypothetical protein